MSFIGLSKPPEQVLSQRLDLGDQAPASDFIVANKKNIVLFLRHTGCPFAEAALKSLSDLAKTQTGLQCTAIFHGNELASKKWIRSFKLSSNMTLIVDEPREVYGLWGIGYSKPAHLLSPMVITKLIKLALKGITNKTASGTRWQQQAAFLVDESRSIQWLHFPRHAGDLPDFHQFLPA